jgi:hypothetical protein
MFTAPYYHAVSHLIHFILSQAIPRKRKILVLANGFWFRNESMHE